MVNNEVTDESDEPYVAMSKDGHWMVVWHDTADPRVNQIFGRVYDAKATRCSTIQNTAGAGDAYAMLGAIEQTGSAPRLPATIRRADGRVRREQQLRCDLVGVPRQRQHAPADPPQSLGVYLREYSMTRDNSGAVAVLRQDTRVNSALAPVSVMVRRFGTRSASTRDSYNAIWPGDQGNSQAAMDANGDLTVSYEGFGPAVTEHAASGADGTALMDEILNLPENGDLLAAFPALANLSLPSRRRQQRRPRQRDRGSADPGPEVPRLHRRPTRPPGRHHEPGGYLVCAGMPTGSCTRSSTPMSSPTNPEHFGQRQLVNTATDGANCRWTISIVKNATSGTFQIRVINGVTGRYQNITITPVYHDGRQPRGRPGATQKAIQDTLKADIEELGINWPTSAEQRWSGRLRRTRHGPLADRSGSHRSAGNVLGLGFQCRHDAIRL